MKNLISIRNFIKLNPFFRCFIGNEIAKKAKEENIKIVKIDNENNYPIDFLEKYFSTNKIPVKDENCEKISLEMIKVLPIKMFTKSVTDEKFTTNGDYIFYQNDIVGKFIDR